MTKVQLGDKCCNQRWFVYGDFKLLVTDLLFEDGSRKVSIPQLGVTFSSNDSRDAKDKAIQAADAFACKRMGIPYNPKTSYGYETIAYHKERYHG